MDYLAENGKKKKKSVNEKKGKTGKIHKERICK